MPRKSPGGRQADEAEHEEAHREPESRTLPAQAAEALERHRRASSRSRAATIAKAPMLIAAYGDEVEEQGALSPSAVPTAMGMSRKPGVRDARIRESRLMSVWTSAAMLPQASEDARDHGQRDRPELPLPGETR